MAVCLIFTGMLADIESAIAQDRKVVGDVAVNIGWVSAAHAAQFEGEAVDHPPHRHKKGVFHMVVALSDANSGAPIRNATVIATIDDPLDRVQRKTLSKRETAGFTDFSEQFEFGAIGRHNVSLEIAIPGRQTRLTVRFIRNYDGRE